MSNQRIDTEKLQKHQYGRELQLGTGLYLFRQRAAAEYWSNLEGRSQGKGGGPAVLKITMPTNVWKTLKSMGAKDNAPTQGFDNDAIFNQSFVPIDLLEAFNIGARFEMDSE